MLQINDLLKRGDPQEIARYMKENDLALIDGKIVPVKEKEAWVKGQIGFWDQRQQAR